MKHKGGTLLRSYQAALRGFIGQGTDARLQPARRLGRRAMALGLETLDLAGIHDRAVLSVVKMLPIRSARERAGIIRRAGKFFATAILPMEATHRTAMDAHRRMGVIHLALIRRTRELSASNRKLVREVARRRGVEESLHKSEQRSARLLQQSRRVQERLKLLSRRILSVQEEDRKRISRELHDIVAQTLTGINVRLAMLKKDAAASTKGLDRKIASAQRLVEKSVDVMHRFARELRPAVLDDLGLIPALHSLLKGFARETSVPVRFTAAAGVEALSGARRTVLYRVAQEALTNVARHARAGRVDVTVRDLPGIVRMQIKDDGRGFDAGQMWNENRNKGHLGMLGLRERVAMVGGTFAVDSAPGRGTVIQIEMPLANGGKQGRAAQ